MSDMPHLSPLRRVEPGSQEFSSSRESTTSKEVGTPPAIGDLRGNGPQADANKGGTLAYYPFTLIMMVIWLAYIAVMFWLLERAANAASATFPQSWWYKRLPDAIQTGFAQGHAAVTAMHLARLAVSALHNQTTAPRSWAELFWLADRNWQGPFGMSAMLIGKKKLRASRLSTTFVLFALTCLVALPTPYIVQRGYSAGVVRVSSKATVVANTFSPGAMSALSAWAQMSRGEGAWTTGLSVLDVYNSSVFVAQGARRDESANDLVISGSLFQDMDIPELPAVRVSGGCESITVDGNPNFLESDDPNKAFRDWCQTRMPAMATWNSGTFTAYNVKSTLLWCTDFDLNNTQWMNTSPASIANGFAWHNATDGESAVRGFIECQSSFATGLAAVRGATRDFSDFKQVPYGNTSLSPQDPFIVHPLFGAFYDLTEPFEVANDTDNTDVVTGRTHALLGMLGFTPQYDAADGGIVWRQGTLNEFATQLTRGVTHMGAAVNSLSQRPNQNITDVRVYHTVSGRIRDPQFIWGGVGLLAVWFLLIVYTTARMFRPTFGPALDSYVAGRLLTNEPGLVRSQCCGELSNNKNFTTPFVRVGDALPGQPYGHVAPGGPTHKLQRGRSYGPPEV